MELRHLRYFVSVAEALSFRRAAEQLRVAQPALSKQIKDLESRVGTTLLDRDTAHVSLTDAGAVFLDEARTILDRVETAAAAAREAASGLAGRLTIGNVGALSASFLPPTLSAFRSKYPNVEVTLQDVTTSEQISALRAGKIQVAFSLHETNEKLPRDFRSLPVLERRVALALGVDHRLAKRSVVSLAEVADEQFFSVAHANGYDQHRQRTERIFAARGIAVRPIKRVGSLESLLALVAGDHGLALLMPTHFRRSAKDIVFRRIKEDGSDLLVTLSALWRGGAGSQLAANFVALLRKQHRTTAQQARGKKSRAAEARARSRG
ncbi:LysR family transcriptional regulator [Opitutaceae bacterium EW11]|nr:LysR family transcriptional regulator [Opitutaceae bacterium EW11]